MPYSIASNRLTAVDLARGIALLGVALVNVHAFAAVWSSQYGLDLATSRADVVAEYAVAILFSHRSYPVLAFLFGVGLAWQWQRLPEGRPRPNALRPRLWALLIIGGAHGLLLWPGDVLTTYAVMGLLLVTLLKRSDAAILRFALGAYALTSLLYAVLGAWMIAAPGVPFAADRTAASFAAVTWAGALARHPVEYWQRGLPQLLVSDFWAHTLLGLWAGRSGALLRFLMAPLARKPVVVIGASLLVAGSLIELIAARHGGWNALSFNDLGSGLMTLAVLPASVGGLWLWLTVAAIWSQRVDSTLKSLVIAAGRAPLTQFIGQSVVFALLFNKSFVGLYGELGRAAYSLIAIATYVLLCGLIRAWLGSGHAHGPMEIVWRRLTNVLSPQRFKPSAP